MSPLTSCQYNSCGHCSWLKLIDYLYYWMAVRSLEEKVAFCLYNKVQKGPGPYYALKYYALKSLQRDEPVKKLTVRIKIGPSGIRHLRSFEADSEHL